MKLLLRIAKLHLKLTMNFAMKENIMKKLNNARMMIEVSNPH